MHKHLFLLVLFLFCSFLRVEAETISCSIDLVSLDSLWSDTAICKIEASCTMSSQFGLSIPFTLTGERTVGGPILLETGLLLTYHPFSNGLYCNLSLLEAGFLFRGVYAEEKAPYLLNTVAFGYNRFFFGRLVLDARLTIRDPQETLEAEYDELALHFTRFPMFRFSLMLGYSWSLKQEGQGT